MSGSIHMLIFGSRRYKSVMSGSNHILTIGPMIYKSVMSGSSISHAYGLEKRIQMKYVNVG